MSRMVVLLRRGLEVPLRDQEVDWTCQKPWELWRGRVSVRGEEG